MSEAAVMRFLGTDSKGILTLIKQRRLKRCPLTGSFARVQVQTVHDEILRSIIGDDGAAMGREQQAMGVQPRFRQNPNLV
jgi:hypothetical protein